MSGNRIDVHAHYLGGSVERLFDGGFSLTGGYRMSARWTVQAAIDFMDRHDIASQILSVPWAFDDARGGDGGGVGWAAKFCRNVNTEYAELIRDHPQRFGAFAAIPAETTDQALAEIEHAIDVLGLDGVLLSSNACGHYLGQEFMEPVAAELAARQLPVLVHPEECPHIGQLGFGRPSSVVEFPFDTARAVTNALYRGVFLRHPDLTLILAHCGGALPMLGWRIAEHTEMKRGPNDADIGPDHVQEVLGRLYYETALAGSAHTLLPTLQVTTTDNILFGSDWPAAPERTVKHNINNLESFAGFSADDFLKVNRGNALKLFPRFSS